MKACDLSLISILTMPPGVEEINLLEENKMIDIEYVHCLKG
jgi:hypothetical protein